jgi:hypothetical protein
MATRGKIHYLSPPGSDNWASQSVCGQFDPAFSHIPRDVTCKHCQNWLKRHGINFKTHNIIVEQTALLRLATIHHDEFERLLDEEQDRFDERQRNG